MDLPFDCTDKLFNAYGKHYADAVLTIITNAGYGGPAPSIKTYIQIKKTLFLSNYNIDR